MSNGNFLDSDDDSLDDDGDEDIACLDDTASKWNKNDTLDARRKLERLFELRRLKEYDEGIGLDDLD